jgi:conjugative relaxase-like TrwC/TraI family protein
VQTTHKIAGPSAAGYAAYVTSLSARGDYYTGTATGTADPEHPPVASVTSRWHGSPELLASLGLSHESAVERDDLVSLMAGRSPTDDRQLRPVGANGTRVAGIDLTFSAPKSVSALWAVTDESQRAKIEAAHSQAVASAIARVEREVALVRTRVGGGVRHDRASRVLAAEVVHTSSRLTRGQEPAGVPDPQLHSHVIVLGAERDDGRFAAVDSRELFRSARVNGAWYRAELAAGLGRLGLEVESHTGRDRRYFELAGVPKQLTELWSARSADIERAAQRFRTRYGRNPKAGELGALTVSTRGTKGNGETVNVDASWRAVGSEHGLTRARTDAMFSAIDHAAERGLTLDERADLGRDLLGALTAERSMVSETELRARAYELAAGICEPAEADRVIDGLTREGELVALEGGRWTTRALREREQQALSLVGARREETTAPVTEASLNLAEQDATERIGAPLSREQRDALRRVTGPGGVSILVGQAGTGKGVVLSAAADAWQRDGHKVLGTAVAGATAERLGAEANVEATLTTDALLFRVANERLALDTKTVVVMDEAGMADTQRLAELVEATERSGSKLVLVGDQAQLPSIGAGGLFEAVQEVAPTAHLTEVHRARQGWEREAWRELRDGRSQVALARYQAEARLHITDTREQAAELMLADWDGHRRSHPGDRTVMVTDASNVELERINASAQERRADANELGATRVALGERPYDLAPGDEVIFTKAHFVPGGRRVENGTLATVLDGDAAEGGLTLRTSGARARDVDVGGEEVGALRLAYAQHVYKAQGATVDRAFVLIGGWQTDRERAYVALSRARDRTDIYVAREDLGEQGMDAGAIERLGEAMAESHAQRASVTVAERDGLAIGYSRERGQDPPTESQSTIGPCAPCDDRERLIRDAQDLAGRELSRGVHRLEL